MAQNSTPNPPFGKGAPAFSGAGQGAIGAKPKSRMGLRIAKNTYVFEIRKKFGLVKNFSVEGTQKQGMEKLAPLLAIARSLPFLQKQRQGAKPKGAQGAAGESARWETGASPKAAADRAGSKNTKRPIYTEKVAREIEEKTQLTTPFFSSLPKIIFAFVFVLTFLLVYFISTFGVTPVPPEADAEAIQPSFGINFTDFGVATYGSEQTNAHSVYFAGNFSSYNVSSASLGVNVYNVPIPSQIFVLQGGRFQADSYPIFRKSLDKYLSYYGLFASDLDPTLLDRVPTNSIIIVPTGYFPESLLGYENSSFSALTLLDRKVTIVYIGLRFDKQYLDDGGFPRTTDQARISNFPVVFSQPNDLVSTTGFGLFDPQYQLLSSSTGVRRLFGSVSATRIKNGFFIALPQTLDSGWRSNGDAAAQDVSNLMAASGWIDPISSGSFAINATNSSNGTFFISTTPYIAQGQYARFVATVQGQSSPLAGYSTNFLISQQQTGELYSKDGAQILSSYLTGTPLRLSAHLAEPSGGEKQLYTQVMQDQDVVKSAPLQKTPTSLQSTVPFDFDASLLPDTYLFRIVDAEGKIYAKAIITVLPLSLQMESQDYGKGDFTLSISSGDNQRVRAPKATVSLNGQNEMDFISQDTFSYHTGPLSPGNYTFGVAAGKMTAAYTHEYKLPKAFYDDPLFLLLGAMSAAMVVVGVYLRRPEMELFGLDIPDFPPMSKIKIPVKVETVKGLFKQVNKDYSWDYMPLKLAEMKNAFRKLTFNGKPIAIGDYNLERVLDKMQKLGVVFEKNGFWGLQEWVEVCGKPGAYLVIFRQLRDVFVNSAVRFTPMLKSEDYDTKVSVGQDLYVHIYLGRATLPKAIGTLGMGTTVLVFEDTMALENFRDSLVSANRYLVSLKLEYYEGRLVLTTPDDFQSVLKNLKLN